MAKAALKDAEAAANAYLIQLEACKLADQMAAREAEAKVIAEAYAKAEAEARWAAAKRVNEDLDIKITGNYIGGFAESGSASGSSSVSSSSSGGLSAGLAKIFGELTGASMISLTVGSIAVLTAATL